MKEETALSKENVASKVSALLAPTVEEMGYVLWDVTYGKEGADYHLTVTIDKEDGITIDDCEAVHHAIDPILDEHDPIDGAYYLNVSSPGIERELRTEAHLLASIGERVDVRLFAALGGKKNFKGTLAAFENGNIVIEAGEEKTEIPFASVSKIKTVYFD